MLEPSVRLYAPLLKEIAEAINEIEFKTSFVSHWNLDFFQRESNQCREIVEKWIPNVELSHFNFFEFEDGITGAINKWLALEKRSIQVFIGDYKWVNAFGKNIEYIQAVDQIRPDAVVYITNPSVIDGNFRADWEDIINKSEAIVLDCAYLGLSDMVKIPINSKIERIFFSLSKNFALTKYRAGFCFSRKAPLEFKLLQNYGYYNFMTPQIISSLSEKFPYNYVSSQLRDAQLLICKDLNIQTSDIVSLGKIPSAKILTENSARSRFCLTSKMYELFPKRFYQNE